ncbi:hypothetical protein ADUPG1_005927 [Aduncisulcus paluster]|uniref:Uncharacterized protein n=1 Tax=Aduncisulcus paluster TaxID=2918883 RepID=A0ABQ5KJ78_9EUKA|nr:hypothetical protein ADUPG1_005927 [Aduncisulcus paluster]
MTIEDIMEEVETLIESIKQCSSRSAIKSLFKESSPRLKAIFDEFTSSPSIITSNMDLFELCFECLSLFLRHKVTKEYGILEGDDIEIILDRSSINTLIHSFLPSMIQVEDILRVKETKERGIDKVGVSTTTIRLLRIINLSTLHCKSLGFSLFPQISSLLSKLISLGRSKKFEDSFIEDLLQTCRNIALTKHNPTKDSLLSLFLPHILHWIKKYPEKSSFPYRSSRLWFVFHPVLDVIKDIASKGITFDDRAVFSCLMFFSNLSCIPSQAIEIHDCIKDGLLDVWFEMVKKTEKFKDSHCGVKHWSKLISILSTVQGIIPHISPKYDTHMEWCRDNGGWKEDYSRYFVSCFSVKKIGDIITAIKHSSDSKSTSELYDKHFKAMYSFLIKYQSKGEIEEHKEGILHCFRCLRLFVRHDRGRNVIHLPDSKLDHLIKTFIDCLSRLEKDLEEVDEEYCKICIEYTNVIHYEMNALLHKIFPTFQRIFERGSKIKLGGNIALYLLKALVNIIPYQYSFVSCIFTPVKSHIKAWLKIYKDYQCYQQWVIIFEKLARSRNCEFLCSEVWPFAQIIFDAVKREFIGDRILFDKRNEYVLSLLSILCCDQFHSIQVYDNVKELLDGWFVAVKRKAHYHGISSWSTLISTLSTVPSLIPHLSPKYDDYMEFCKSTHKDENFVRYFSNCYHSLKGLFEYFYDIEFLDSKSKSKLYHEHRDEILSVFLQFHSRILIEEHKQEIILFVKCLDLFLSSYHSDARKRIHLPYSDQCELIDTFIEHLSRFEEVLGEAVDQLYCQICAEFTGRARYKKLASFLPKIFPTLKRILERGSKEKLGGNIALNLLITLTNFSYFSASFSTRSSILTLIKPYIGDWLKIYNDSEHKKIFLFVLQKVTLPTYKSPEIQKSLCSEAWSLFHPVLDVVKGKLKFVMRHVYQNALSFFSNLCCDHLHAIEVYDNIKDLLDDWFEALKKDQSDLSVIESWFILVDTLSSVSILEDQISSKFDSQLTWCKNRWKFYPIQYEKVVTQSISMLSYYGSLYFSKLLHTVPIVLLIPSIETSLCPEKDGYSYASHICFAMKFEITVPQKENSVIHFNIINQKEMKVRCVYSSIGSCNYELDCLRNEQEPQGKSFFPSRRIVRNSILQFNSPEKKLVKVSFTEERSVRQSIYDFIEKTSCGVETFFDGDGNIIFDESSETLRRSPMFIEEKIEDS